METSRWIVNFVAVLNEEEMKKKIRSFMCNILGWHSPKTIIVFDGCSLLSKCKHCKRTILQDSQGNWFSTDQL